MTAGLPDECEAPRRWPTAVRFAAYTALLFASWNHNVFGVVGGVGAYRAEPRTDFFGYESFLVLNRLRMAADGSHPAFPLVVFYTAEGPSLYRSQFGGQGIALSALQTALGVEPHDLGLAAASAFALLTAAAFASIFAVAGRRFGPVAGDVAAVLAAPAPLMLMFSPSLYWASFLLIAPFALVWAFGGCVAAGGRGWGALLAAVGLATFAKSLCGYEYIVTVVGGAAAALWYHQHRLGVPPARRWRASAAVAAAGGAGFALAIAVHCAQLAAVLDVDPVSTIYERAAYRLNGDGREQIERRFDSDWFGFLPDRVAYPANCFVEYFRQPAVATSPHWGRWHVGLSLKYLVLLALAAGIGSAIRGGRNFGALMGAAGLALLAGAAWQVIALNHMCIHTHMNGIVYYMGFVPLALVAVGCGIDALADRLGVRRLVPWALVALVLTAATDSLARADLRNVEAAEAERAAVAAVRALPAGATPREASVSICVDVFGTEPHLHPNIAVDLGLIRQTVPPAEREPLVLLVGWAADCVPAKRPRSPRVVVAANGEVLPAWACRYGRPDVDRGLGRTRPEACFVVAVPRRLVPDFASLRVYAVSHADPTRVTTAKLPPFRE